jgi:hypothetical protein
LLPELDLALVGERPGGFDRFGEDLDEVELGLVEHEPALVHLCHEEEILDEAKQAIRIAIDDLQVLVSLGRAHPVSDILEQDRKEATDRGERCPQLVRDLRYELVLDLRSLRSSGELGRTFHLALDGIVVAVHEAGHTYQDQREQRCRCDSQNCDVEIRCEHRTGEQERRDSQRCCAKQPDAPPGESLFSHCGPVKCATA